MADNQDADVRNAMRAFLQRCEVRLSTMHRIANAFLSGAGLLVLFPVFYGTSIKTILDWMIRTPLVYSDAPLFMALLITFFIPLWSLYLLVHDLTRFYFVGQQPGYHTGPFNPTFALSGLAFPCDEDAHNTAKAQVIIDQYTEEFIPFVVPFSEKIADSDFGAGGASFQPDTRRIETLMEQGIIEKKVGDDPVFARSHRPLDITLFNRFNEALAIAGLYDRPLHQEVAKIEVSLVRHNRALRRIVIRYVKSLLTMVLLFLSSFVISSFLEQSDRLSKIHVFALTADELFVAIALMLWAFCAALLVKRPIEWIYKTSDPRRRVKVKDPSLKNFEKWFLILCFAVFFMSLTYLSMRLSGL